MKLITLGQIVGLKRAEYARGTLDKELVGRYLAAQRAAGKKWLFPPIEIRPVTIKRGGKQVQTFKVVDGNHRFAIAKILRFTHIPTEFSPVNTDTEAFLRQVDLNADRTRGAQFTRKQLYHLCTVLHETYKIGVTEIAKRTGYSKANVSKILRGEIGFGEVGGARVGAGRPKKGAAPRTSTEPEKDTKEAARQTPPAMRFFEWLRDALTVYAKYKGDILKFVPEHREELAMLLDRSASMMGDLLAAKKE